MNNREPQDLFELDYRFALSKLDPRLGEIEMAQVTYIYGSIFSEEKIDLVNCGDLFEDENWETFFSFDRIRTNLNAGKLVCPDVNSIEVRNQFGDDVFSYMRLRIK